jgi:hypothetical protein
LREFPWSAGTVIVSNSLFKRLGVESLEPVVDRLALDTVPLR